MTSLRKNFSKTSFTAWAFYTLIAFVSFLSFFPRTYLSNDDPEISRLINFNSFSMFVSPIVGRFISLLSEFLNPSFNGYGLTLYVFQWLSCCLICWAACHLLNNKKLVLGLALIVVFLFSLIMTVRLTFTQSAFYLSASWGLIGIYVFSKKSMSNWRSICLLLVAGFFGGVGYLVRSESFYYTVILLSPLVVLMPNNLRDKILGILVLLLFPVLIFFLNTAFYKSLPAEMVAYNQYNHARGQVHEFRFDDSAEFRNQLEVVGISKFEWDIFQQDWIFFDQEIYSEKSIWALVKFRKQIALPNLAELSRGVLNVFQKLWGIVLLCFSILFVLVEKKDRYLYLGYLLFEFSMFLILELFFRLPVRFYIPASFCLFIFSFAAVSGKLKSKIDIRSLGLFASFAFIGLCSISYHSYKTVKDSKNATQSFETARNEIEKFKGHVLIVQPSKEWEGIDPLKKDPLSEFKFLNMGCLTFSPLFWSNLKEYFNTNKGSNIFTNIKQNEIPTIIVGTKKWVSRLSQFLKNKYSLEIHMTAIANLPNKNSAKGLLLYEVR